MNKLVFIILCSLPLLVAAQSKADYTWVFGSNAESLPGSEGSILQFNANGKEIWYQPIAASLGQPC